MLWIWKPKQTYCQNNMPHHDTEVWPCDQFPDGVVNSAEMILLGISHLWPLSMTVNGKTYGSTRRRNVCIRVEKGSAKRRATTALFEVTLVAGWHLQGDTVVYTGIGWVLCFPSTGVGGGGTLSEWPSHLTTRRQLLHFMRKTVWWKLKTENKKEGLS